jgi:hypothetical protein
VATLFAGVPSCPSVPQTFIDCSKTTGACLLLSEAQFLLRCGRWKSCDRMCLACFSKLAERVEQQHPKAPTWMFHALWRLKQAQHVSGTLWAYRPKSRNGTACHQTVSNFEAVPSRSCICHIFVCHAHRGSRGRASILALCSSAASFARHEEIGILFMLSASWDT